MGIFEILTLVGGLALFLYGMDVMGDGLKKLAGGRMEMILAKLTSNPFKGFMLGFIVTAIIQSSSATTVMLVGFVNSGIMKLGQTISIIMGANVGTTVTAWLLSLSGIEGEVLWLKLLKPSSFTPVLAVIGVVITMFSKSDKKKNIATILLGFAVLMFGMEAMSDAVSGLKDDPGFKNMLVMFENPLMGIIMGTVLTAIIQSSSASVGILQALSMTGAIPFAMAIPIIMGQNIGTTITPILSAISGNRDSKRVAFACLLIKMLGVIIVAPVFYILHAFVNFAFMEAMIDPFWIAIIHTLFNILTTVVLIPFCPFIEKCSIKAVRGKKNQKEEEQKNDAFSALDERFISIPSFAIDTSRHLVCDMALLAQRSFESATELISKYDKDIAEKVRKEENEVDHYEDKISSYLVKVSGQNLTAKDSHAVTSLLHCVGDIERISDHAVNMCEAAEEIKEKGIEFSEEAKKDLEVISAATREVLLLAVHALLENNLDIAKKVEPLEQVIDKLKRKIKNNHIKRLQEGNCTIEYGFVLSDLLTNYERVADHCSNIAVCLLEIAVGALDTHEYLSHVKKDGENEFFEQYDYYKAKYTL